MTLEQIADGDEVNLNLRSWSLYPARRTNVEGVCSPNHRGRMREGPGAHLSDETQTPPRSHWPK